MHLCNTFENPLLYNSPLRIVYRADLYLMRLASTASGSMFSSKYFLSWYVQSPGLGRISAIMISSGSAVLGLVRCATDLRPASKASYSAWLLVALKSNLMAHSTVSPSGVVMTIPARCHACSMTHLHVISMEFSSLFIFHCPPYLGVWLGEFCYKVGYRLPFDGRFWCVSDVVFAELATWSVLPDTSGF
ncbi:hypothetical protein LWI29_028566 [Acer saccharum]|uniref:Uncharacterized protein n=1 Tax=Acer saccharum TaxID=4024 RepID=A0AA39VPE3_ACESA|nr:hypothetical protein LWI29_028566 [Acer saccharum]